MNADSITSADTRQAQHIYRCDYRRACLSVSKGEMVQSYDQAAPARREKLIIAVT